MLLRMETIHEFMYSFDSIGMYSILWSPQIPIGMTIKHEDKAKSLKSKQLLLNLTTLNVWLAFYSWMLRLYSLYIYMPQQSIQSTREIHKQTSNEKRKKKSAHKSGMKHDCYLYQYTI